MRVYLTVTAVAVGLLAVWAARGDVGLAGYWNSGSDARPQLVGECSELRASIHQNCRVPSRSPPARLIAATTAG